MKDLEERCINALRMLSIDTVQHANSGHPGMPMGAATMAYVLWTRHLRHNPANPLWPDRDRFALSAGHAIALLYALLFLTGYDLTLDDLEGAIIGVPTFGASAPGPVVMREFGFTPEHVVETAKAVLHAQLRRLS